MTDEPKSYGLGDVLVTADGRTRTLLDWQDDDVAAATTSVTDLDGVIAFDYDDPGHPRDVVVYTNGRPPAQPPAEELTPPEE